MRNEIEEGHLFKHPVTIVLLDGPLEGKHINATHRHCSELVVYQPEPLVSVRGQLSCMPFQNVVKPHYRYRFVDYTCNMREAFYEYDGEM